MFIPPYGPVKTLLQTELGTITLDFTFVLDVKLSQSGIRNQILD